MDSMQVALLDCGRTRRIANAVKAVLSAAEGVELEVKIPRIAECDGTVLIEGETGTGKEICARAIHYLSPRTGGPFIAVNCGAIPTELVENELFGHEPGAFTGAVASVAGLAAEADGGTLFLDEVDCLPVTTQTKLLRFLQDRQIKPLGACKSREIDVRTIASARSAFVEEVCWAIQAAGRGVEPGGDDQAHAS